MQSYKELLVWQKAVNLVILVYSLTAKFPKHEQFVLVSQIRRCAISIPSNVAEGYTRHSTRDFIRFLKIGIASGAELETQLIISIKLGYINESEIGVITSQLEEIQRMLNKLIQSLVAKL